MRHLHPGNIDAHARRPSRWPSSWLRSRCAWLAQESASSSSTPTWALVHYLMFGEEKTTRHGWNHFDRLPARKDLRGLAIKEAFGDVTHPYEGMRLYVARPLFQLLRGPRADRRGGVFASQRPPRARLRGCLHVAIDRPVEHRR